MKEKGKSINSLMKHIRDHHNIDIGKGRSRDKQELLNMGYFHAYKAYKFVKTIDDPLDILNCQIKLEKRQLPICNVLHEYF